MSHIQDLLNLISLEKTDKYNNNVIHLLVKNNNNNILNKYLSNNINQLGGCINNKNNNGDTPLHIAAKNNNDKIANTLISYGANPKIKNNEGLYLINKDIKPQVQEGGYLEKKIIYGKRKL